MADARSVVVSIVCSTSASFCRGSSHSELISTCLPYQFTAISKSDSVYDRRVIKQRRATLKTHRFMKPLISFSHFMHRTVGAKQGRTLLDPLLLLGPIFLPITSRTLSTNLLLYCLNTSSVFCWGSCGPSPAASRPVSTCSPFSRCARNHAPIIFTTIITHYHGEQTRLARNVLEHLHI